MKTNILKAGMLITAFILLSSLLFSFIFPGTNKQTSPSQYTLQNPERFYYGAIQSIWSYPNYDALGLNLTHCYVGTEDSVYPGNPNRHTPLDWVNDPNKHLFDPVPVTALNIAKTIMFEHNQSRFLWQRPKIEWLAGDYTVI